MKFANFLTKTKQFLLRKIAELIGIFVTLISVILLISLLTYSPNDPNFIIDKNSEIQNLMGYRGSVISDFLFQSVGLVSYLIPLTLFFSGLNIFLTKKYILIIENLFFCILYICSGTIFFSYFQNQSYFLTINGNGGFIGQFFNKDFLRSVVEINTNVSYYLLIVLTLIFLLKSINFRIFQISSYLRSIKEIFNFQNKQYNINNTII